MDLQAFLSIDSLVTGIAALIFGLMVLSRNKDSIVNRTLFLLTTATAFWSVAYWRWLSIYDDGQTALFWVRILTVGSTFIPLFYFHWVISLLDYGKRFRIFLMFVYPVSIIAALLSFSPLMVYDVRPVADVFAFWPIAGPLYAIYLFAGYFGLVSLSLILLANVFRRSVGERRIQIAYVIAGSLIGFGGGATNFFLWYGIDILPLGNPLVIVYPAVFSYAIVKHSLMDIRFVLRRYSVYTISIAITVALALLGRYLVISAKGPQGDSFYYFVLFFAIAIHPLIRKRVSIIANRYFFSSLYDADKLIAAMSDRLRSTLDRRQIYESVHGFLDSAMHPKSFCILLTALEEIGFTSEYASGITLDKLIRLPNNEYMTESFIKHQKPWVISEFKELHQNKQNAPAIHYLEQLGLEIVCPLVVKNRVAGLMAFGQKESGDLYNNEDIEVITIVSTQAAIAIENAQLYDETRSFGVRLVREIDRKRKELTDANERLRKLDVAKSEFISIASHQLRTPLTVIKGYISMMIEGNFGKMSETISDCLNKVYVSNERLINLVENLLNISRIESGTVRFNFAPARLDDIVQRAVNELLGSAKNKGIKLDFKLMKRAAIEASFDADKLRQVVINIIDNAIKYTSAGTVSIRLDTADDKLVFTVSDKGSGLSPDDIPNLFRKFNRGSGAMLEYTEGTGLGLYVAKQMIDAHHGRIWAESQGKGMGALFGFEIPIVQQ